MTAIDIQELLEIGPHEQGNSFVKTQKQELYMHQIFLDEEIGEPKKYRDFINMLYLSSSENAEYNVFVNSPGGCMTAAMAIVEAIYNSDSNVRAILNGECHSAASIIALNCDEIVVTDQAHMLIHTAQFGTGGFTQNVKAHADFSAIYINKILDSTYSGFLSTEELSNVKQGVEIWFNADEIRVRLKNKQKYISDKLKKTKPKRIKSTELVE